MLNGIGQIGVLGGLGGINQNLAATNRSIQDVKNSISDMNTQNQLTAKWQAIEAIENE